MKTQNVEIGLDMFGNQVKVGQKVLYCRAAPGGVGIGIVTHIRECVPDEGKKLYEFSGHEYYRLNKVDKKYEFEIRTQFARNTWKNASEIIAYVDETILKTYSQTK